MSIKAAVGPELPFLRRYARTLTGSQTLGDAAVRETLEALLEDPDAFDTTKPARLELYRTFHHLWHGMTAINGRGGLVASLPIVARQSLLLTAIEGFSIADAADILDSDIASVTLEIKTARQAIADSLTAQVLIIEDESIIALHIKSIVEDLQHHVTGIARTRGEAIDLANRFAPELVLADISLADGSSGIDAVKDILGTMNVPVIFITAFPERLLTGERPEPTYLITKPFEPETVTATIGQALLFHREQTALATPAVLVMDEVAPNPRKHFDTPEALLADPDLSDEEKQVLLTEWDSEVDGRLNAEAEGMSPVVPSEAHKEGRLADEATHVKNALTEITEKNAEA